MGKPYVVVTGTQATGNVVEHFPTQKAARAAGMAYRRAGVVAFIHDLATFEQFVKSQLVLRPTANA